MCSFSALKASAQVALRRDGTVTMTLATAWLAGVLRRGSSGMQCYGEISILWFQQKITHLQNHSRRFKVKRNETYPKPGSREGRGSAKIARGQDPCTIGPKSRKSPGEGARWDNLSYQLVGTHAQTQAHRCASPQHSVTMIAHRHMLCAHCRSLVYHPHILRALVPPHLHICMRCQGTFYDG